MDLPGLGPSRSHGVLVQNECLLLYYYTIVIVDVVVVVAVAVVAVAVVVMLDTWLLPGQIHFFVAI